MDNNNKNNAKKPASKNFNTSNKMNQEFSTEFDNIKKSDTDKNKNSSYSTDEFIKTSQSKSNQSITNEKDNKNRTT